MSSSNSPKRDPIQDAPTENLVFSARFETDSDLPASQRLPAAFVARESVQEEEYEELVRQMEERGGVIEYCSSCGAAVDVSECYPLTPMGCPGCGKEFIVLQHFGRFLLLSVLGQGGMGYVCRAFDNTLQRDVALKLLRKNLINDADYLEHLENEARAAASISHPNVVKVYSAGVENGFYFICMEIVTGGTLARYIQQKKRLSEAEALRIGIEVAEGLEAAFAVDLLHRDVKPGNILFTELRVAKVADFGLAIRVDGSSVETEIWGTPYYLPPESLLGKPLDVRADIYSLGATLYHAITGRPVFEAPTAMEVAQKQINATPLPVQTFASETSGQTAYVIAQMLRKDPVATSAELYRSNQSTPFRTL